jgi:hypothetical protein
LQDFDLAFGQRPQGLGKRLIHAPLTCELSDEPTRDRWREQRLAGVDNANGVKQPLRGAIFE